MKGNALQRVMIAFVAAACLIYLPKILSPGARFYVDVLTPSRMQLLGAIAKLACMSLGAFFGFRIAAVLEKTNPARVPWLALGVWLAFWTAGQLILMAYPFVLGVEPPFPGVADPMFLVGFVFAFPALVRFVYVYRASGFPVGTAREHAVIAAATTAVVVVFSYAYLAPIARADGPLGARFFNVVYPATDLLALVPTVVLIRIALAFRPGRVWAVWAALAAGFVFLAAGDFISTYLYPSVATSFDPAVHLSYLLGYLFVVCGLRLQLELVKGA